MRLIATEEGFATPQSLGAMRAYLDGHPGQEMGVRALNASFDPKTAARWFTQLTDLGDLRSKIMDEAGIHTQVLLHAATIQALDADEGIALSCAVNDAMADLKRSDPNRYAPLVTLAPQDAAAAALELERGINRLALHGGLINSHTKGEYLDDPKFWAIFEAAEALNAPIYLHPREPSEAMLDAFRTYNLMGPIWGYAAETGLHALRLIMGGVFDRFPRLRIVLGHLGEGLPFFIDRIDIRYREDGSPGRPRLKRRPSDYLRENFYLTTSGMNWLPSVKQCIEVMGQDRIMFAADWPFEDAVDAAQRFRSMPFDDLTKRKIAHLNAERVFSIQSAS